MKHGQRVLLKKIFTITDEKRSEKLREEDPKSEEEDSKSEEKGSSQIPTLDATKLSQVGYHSGNKWFYYSHGQGISANDIQDEARAAGLCELSRLAANKIAACLNNNVNINATNLININTIAQELVSNVPEPIFDAESTVSVGASENAELFLDLAKKDNPDPQRHWMFNLALGLLCVSPLAMFAALGGVNMVCGDKNERDCSDTTKLLMEGLFGTLFGLGSVALTGMFTAFSMESPRDRDMNQWMNDTFHQSNLRSAIASSRYYIGELSLGVVSSVGMMMFITKTLKFLVEKIQGNDKIDSHDPTLVAINSILLIVAGYACIKGNTNNIHNLHQRIYHRQWRNLLNHMQSFDQATREKLSSRIEGILDDRSKKADIKHGEIITLILSQPKGNVMSDGRYYASLTVGALALLISAYAQYFITGCDAVPYFGKVLTGQLPPDINISTPQNFSEGAAGVVLTATNFMVMFNALCCFLNDQFLAGETTKRTQDNRHRKLGGLLALMPAGAAVSQVFVLNPNTSLALSIWEKLCSIANGGQAWLFGITGAAFVLSKCGNISNCCKRSPSPERRPLLSSSPTSSLSSLPSAMLKSEEGDTIIAMRPQSTEVFNRLMGIVSAYIQSSRDIPFPLTPAEIKICESMREHSSAPTFGV